MKRIHFSKIDCGIFLAIAIYAISHPDSGVWQVAVGFLLWKIFECIIFDPVVDHVVERVTFTLDSQVEGFEGPCLPTWLNHNQVDNRLDGGVTGFFKLVDKFGGVPIRKKGAEFHGIIKDGKVYSTALADLLPCIKDFKATL